MLVKQQSKNAVSLINWEKMYKRLAPNSLSWETVSTGMATVIDQAIVSGASFSLSVILARRAPKEELGIYALGISIVLLVTGLQNSLITMPYIFYSPRPDGRIDARYAGSTLVHACGLAIVVAIGILVMAAVAPHSFDISGLGGVIWVLAGAIFFILLREYARRACFAWRQPNQAIAMDLLAAAIQIGGLLFLSRIGPLSAAAAFSVTGASLFIAGLWWFTSNRHLFRVSWSAIISDLNLNWSFGKWIVAGGLIYTARSNLYPWFLAKFHGTATTATFAACVGVTLFSNPFFIAVGNFIGPKAAHNFATGGLAALRRVVYISTVLVAAFMGIFAAAILIMGEKLVTLIYGNQYAGTGSIISILMFSLVAGAVALGVDAALYAMNRPSAIFVANGLGLFVTVFFGFWMAKYYGALGAAYGLLAANIVTGASKYFSFWRLSKDLANSAAPSFPRVDIVGQSLPLTNTQAEG